MELELVRFKMTSYADMWHDTYSETRTILAPKNNVDIRYLLPPYLKVYGVWPVEKITVVGTIDFHQEDAFALGLKVGDIL